MKLLLLIFSWSYSSAQIWRYTNWNIASSDLPSFNVPVTLEHMHDGEYVWEASDCFTETVRGRNKSVVELHCFSPGLHEIRLTNSSTVSYEIWIPFENTPNCYSWIAVQTEDSNGESLGISLWVSDSSAASADKDISRQFQLLGERPSIRVETYLKVSTVRDEGYDSECSCWRFNLTAGGSQLPLEIVYEARGRGVSLLNCGIRPTRFMASNPKYQLDYFLTPAPTVQNHTNAATVHFYQDPSMTGIIMVTKGSTNVITQDGFQTVASLQVDDGEIEGAAFSSTGISILVDQRVHVLVSGSSDTVLSSGLPQSGMDEITGRARQQFGYDNQDIVVGFSLLQETNAVYLSTDGGRSFSELSLRDQYSVHCLRVHPVRDELMLLVTVNETTAKFISYDLGSEVWNERGNLLVYQGGRLTFDYFPGHFADILVWGGQEIFYTTHRGVVVQPLDLLCQENGTIIRYPFRDDEYIMSVALGYPGQISLTTTTYSLFYGRLSTGSALVVLHHHEFSFTFFNKLQNLKMASITSNMELSVHTIPIHALLLNSLYPPTGCSFIEWSSNIQENQVYFVDKNEILEFWAAVVPRPWTSNQISLAVSEEDVVTLRETLTEEQAAVAGAVKRNMSVEVMPHSDAQNKSNTVLKFSATGQTMSCKQPGHKEANIHLTCPPLRHLRLRGKTTNGCLDYQNYTYSISKNYYDPELRGRSSQRASTEKRVPYDVEAWGCPIEVRYNQKYKPVLELYDGDSYKHQVTVNFVLREIHGRTDYGYNATSKDAKCNRMPQKWTEMLSSSDPYVAWTSENYQSCFEGDDDDVVQRVSYEVLNSTGVSAITWRSHDGIYVFTATVVEKSYSYCNLTVTFAVEVYGASSESYLGYILFFLTCILGALGLVLSYFSYRQLIKSGRMSKTN